MVLRGKHKPSFTPHVDCGDNVIVINAEKMKLTGNKMTEKQYVRHTGYPGGQRTQTPEDLLAKKPEAVVEKAVKGNATQRAGLEAPSSGTCHVFAGENHPHEAQQPKKLDLNNIK